MAAITVHSGPDDNWLGKTIEEVLEPDIPIVDPRHHLWLRSGYTYLMPELAADLDSGNNVVATVFAECHLMYRQDGPEAERSLGETEFVAGQAAMSDSGSFGNTRACTVMFGNVDMMMGDEIEPLLDRHMERSGGRSRGLRYSTGWDAYERIRNVAPDAGILVSEPVKDAAGVESAAWSVARHLALPSTIGRSRGASGRNTGPDDRSQSCRQPDPWRPIPWT